MVSTGAALRWALWACSRASAEAKCGLAVHSLGGACTVGVAGMQQHGLAQICFCNSTHRGGTKFCSMDGLQASFMANQIAGGLTSLLSLRQLSAAPHPPHNTCSGLLQVWDELEDSLVPVRTQAVGTRVRLLTLRSKIMAVDID